MDFNLAFDKLMGHEGGYVNHPSDPGGETQWGISKRAYPTLDIKALTRDDAKAIYKRDYWDKIEGVSDLVRFHVFDFAVNSGLHSALATLKRVQPLDELPLIMALSAARLELMVGLKAWPTFGKGWARRIASNLRIVK